jgi:hypothetical protein
MKSMKGTKGMKEDPKALAKALITDGTDENGSVPSEIRSRLSSALA